jgi:hypothetical protein
MVNGLADSNCTFSSFATSRSKHPSHTSQAYSNVGLMKVRYIFDRVCLERVNFSFLRTLTCLKAAFTMLSIWFVQFPSDAKVYPKCLLFSTGSPLNRRSKCGTSLVEISRALVFSIKYISYLHKTNIRICLRGMGWVFWTRSSKTRKSAIRIS